MASFIKILSAFLKYFTGLLIFIIAITVTWQVLARYIFTSDSSWTVEISVFALLWASLFGGAYVYGEDKHLAVSILPDALAGKKSGFRLNIFFSILILLFALIMFSGGIIVAQNAFMLGQKTPVLGILRGYVYLAVPLSAICIAVFALNFLRIDWLSLKAFDKGAAK